MKFADFPYQRPDYPAVMEKISDLTAQLNAATSAQQQIDIYKQLEELSMELSTASTICTIRYTVDTRDKFYSDEQEYNEQMSPLVHEKLQEFDRIVIRVYVSHAGFISFGLLKADTYVPVEVGWNDISFRMSDIVAQYEQATTVSMYEPNAKGLYLGIRSSVLNEYLIFSTVTGVYAE